MERAKRGTVSGPHFGGWELYHSQGVRRLDPATGCGAFLAIERLVRPDDPALRMMAALPTWNLGRQRVRLATAFPAPINGMDGHPASVGVSSASGISNRPLLDLGYRLRRRRRCGALSHHRRRRKLARAFGPACNHDSGPRWCPGRRRHVPAYHLARSGGARPHFHRHFGRRRFSQRRLRRHLAAEKPRV